MIGVFGTCGVLIDVTKPINLITAHDICGVFNMAVLVAPEAAGAERSRVGYSVLLVANPLGVIT